jgi:hypothetical protein
MFKDRKRRVLMAAFGGAIMLAGVGTTGTAMAAKFRADLSGEHLASAGDSDGWGRAKIRVDDTFNELCVDLEVRSIGEVTSAQIHRGAEGVEGPAVVNLDRPDDDSDSEDCDNIGDELADAIQANPGEYYVLIQTTDHPQGALRGQLNPSTG